MKFRQEKPVVEGLQIRELLGKGNFGEVWKATITERPAHHIMRTNTPDRPAQITVALKVFKIHLHSDTPDSLTHQIQNPIAESGGKLLPDAEIATWRQLTAKAASDPRANIVPMCRVYTTPPDSSGPRRCVSMELCRGGTLQQLLDDTWRGVLREREGATLARRVAEALCFCHRNGVLHLDVTPRNILFTADRSCYPTWSSDGRLRLLESAKLGDFGLSCHVSEPSHPKRLGRCRGTLSFMAPEVFKYGIYSAASDAWGLGAVLLKALVGVEQPLDIHKSSHRTSHSSEFDFDVNKDVHWVEGCVSKSTSKMCAWHDLSPLAKENIKGLLCLDPDRRLHLEELLESPWLNRLDS